MQATDDQEGSTIRVSIKSATSDENENGSQGPDSESATSSEGEDSPTEQDWEQAPTRKHMVHKAKWVVLKRKQNNFQF